MKWTVASRPVAIAELADIWVNATDRRAVTVAADRIEAELRVDGDLKGQPFSDDRIIIVRPVAAVYSVSPDDCLLTILHFRLAE